MNFVQYMANTIQTHIPLEILDLALHRNINQSYRQQQSTTKLIQDLMLPKLKVDLSLSRGVELEVQISDTQVVFNDESNVILYLPDSILKGRPIMSAMTILNTDSIQSFNDNSTIPGLYHTLHDRTIGRYDAHAQVEMEVVSGNEILIKNVDAITTGILRVVVAYDENMSEVTPRYYMELSKLAILRAKMYIYITMVVKINKGSVYYGQELPVVESIISEYADSASEYIDEVNINGSKLLFMNDEDSYTDFIKLSLGGNML